MLRLVQNVAERTIKRYNAEARGPEKWDILRTYPTPQLYPTDITILRQKPIQLIHLLLSSTYIMKDILPRIILVAREAGSNDQIKLKSIQRELVQKTNELTEALAKERLLKKKSQTRKNSPLKFERLEKSMNWKRCNK